MKLGIFFLLSINLSFVFAQTGPGGIGSTDGTSMLEYWIDAGTNVSGTTPITSWSDLSGNGITNTINGNPALIAGSINGQKVVRFDVVGDFIQTNLSVNSGTFPNLTIVTVYKPRVDNAGGVWGEDDAGWDRFLFDAANINATFNSATTNGAGPVTSIPNMFPVATTVIGSVNFNEDVASGSYAYANGTLQSTFTSNHGPEVSNNLQIASIGSSNFLFDGDIAEMIIFSARLNDAQRIILDNYLAAKYGLALTSGDIYDEDDALNGHFDFNVASIGRVDASNIHSSGQGSGIVKILSPSGLDDNEFLSWGHNGNIQQATNVTDVPATVQARFERVWRVSEVNASSTAVDVGSIEMQWDLSDLGTITASDLRLLVDTNNDGLFADETPVSGATLVSGNIYSFAGVTSIVNNARFTLATINASQTALPIELEYFTATSTNSKTVKLAWKTTTEENTTYFDVQRSKDNLEWEKITTIAGVGKTSQSADYSVVDERPLTETSYYRLVQTSNNNEVLYSEIKSVHVSTPEQHSLYAFPNPSSDIITIEGIPEGELGSLQVLNVVGVDLSHLLQTYNENESQAILGLSGLVPGLYVIKTKTAAGKIYKQ